MSALGDFLGNIAVVGPGGAGKTRMMVQLANSVEGQKYPWDETKNFLGTLSVIPFQLKYPLKSAQTQFVKVIFSDQPGQSSLTANVLETAKRSQYKGFILVVDSTAWIFRRVAEFQAQLLSQFLPSSQIPVLLITSKSDFADLLFKSLMEEIAELLEESVNQITRNQKIFYYNRISKKEEYFHVNLIDGWIPFTELEQIFINKLDSALLPLNLPEITPMNTRILIRSLLFGFCEYYREKFPQLISSYPVFQAIDNELINSLNYFRPSAWECQTPWRVLSSKSKVGLNHQTKLEIPFNVQSLTKLNIKFILNNYVVAKLAAHESFQAQLQVRNPHWKIISSCYSNSIRDLSRIKQCVEQYLGYLNISRKPIPQKEMDIGLNYFNQS